MVGSLSLLLTIPLAWASERWIERPSIRLGRYTSSVILATKVERLELGQAALPNITRNRLNLVQGVRSAIVLGALPPGPLAVNSSPTPVKEWLNVSRSGRGTQYLASGWDEPEEFGVWGRAEVHALRLRYGSLPERDVELQLDVEALLVGAHNSQQADVFAGGLLLATLNFTNSANRGVRKIRLPRSAAHGKARGAELVVEFHPNKLLSPHDLQFILTGHASPWTSAAPL